MDTRQLRAQTYEILSELFKEPSPELAEDVQSGRLQEFLADAFQRLNVQHGMDGLTLSVRDEGAFEELRRQYDDLFNHPFRHLVPVESVYGPTHSFMGEPAREMQVLYERVGVQPPPQYAAMPDHLCLQLEFMSLLCREGTPELQRQFLAKHFGWMEKLVQDSLQLEGSSFYLAALDVAMTFVRHEQASQGLASNQDYSRRKYNRPFDSMPLSTTFSGGER